jgi:hypothetical protein
MLITASFLFHRKTLLLHRKLHAPKGISLPENQIAGGSNYLMRFVVLPILLQRFHTDIFKLRNRFLTI